MKKLAIALFFIPYLSFATVVMTVDGGVQSCYQYGVDHITGTITFTGTSNQWQFGLSSLDLTGYANYPDVRYVTNGSFTSPITFDIDFTGAYDGSIESYLPIETYQIYAYAQSDGFQYINPTVFTLQSDPCVTTDPDDAFTGLSTTTPMSFYDDLFVWSVLIFFLSFGVWRSIFSRM